MKHLSNYLICKNCSTSILKQINPIFPKCCPDANFIPLLLYLQNSIYSERLEKINNNKSF